MVATLRIFLELAFWGFTTALVMVGFALMLAMGATPVFAYGAPALLIILIPMVALVVRGVREKRARSVLIHLEQAVRLNLPLPRMMLAARMSERAALADRLEVLRRMLEEGQSISEAIESAVPEAGARTINTIAAAEQIGQLAPTLRRLAAETQPSDELSDPTARPFRRIYPLVLVLAVAGTVLLLAIFVMPKLEQIFVDFGMRMPAITQQTLEVARVAGPLVLLFGSILLLIVTGRFFWDTIKPFGLELKSLGIVDRVLWSLPLAHGYALNRGMADACALLGDATSGGIPIDRAIMEASRLPVNAVLRARLMEWADRVSEGRPLADAGREAGIPRVLIDMLATACSTRNASELFRFFESYYRARFSRVRYVLEAMVIPLTALVMGLVVACVALSLFVPLVAMINHLCATPMKL